MKRYPLSSQNMAVKWTKKALADLATILEYIAHDNPERARTFASEIKAKVTHLANFPGMGRPGRVLGTRELVIHENYIVPYRVSGGIVVVARVQHVARKWPKLP